MWWYMIGIKMITFTQVQYSIGPCMFCLVFQGVQLNLIQRFPILSLHKSTMHVIFYQIYHYLQLTASTYNFNLQTVQVIHIAGNMLTELYLSSVPYTTVHVRGTHSLMHMPQILC